MNPAVLMHVPQRERNQFNHPLEAHLDGVQFPLLDEVLEIRRLEQLHHVIGFAARGHQLVEFDDVGVGQALRNGRFVLQCPSLSRVLERSRQQELHGVAIGCAVLDALPDLTRLAHCHGVEQLVFANQIFGVGHGLVPFHRNLSCTSQEGLET